MSESVNQGGGNGGKDKAVLQVLERIPQSLAQGGACVTIPDAEWRRNDKRNEETWLIAAS